MQAYCPTCERLLKRPEQKKYLTGKYTAHYNVGYSKLYLFRCSGRRGCHHSFLVREDIPLDERLARQVSLYHNWKAWHEGEFIRPGVEKYGTTAAEYTDEIHKDVALSYQYVLYGKQFRFEGYERGTP